MAIATSAAARRCSGVRWSSSVRADRTRMASRTSFMPSGIEEPVEATHPVEQLRQMQLARLELVLGRLGRSVGVGMQPPCGQHHLEVSGERASTPSRPASSRHGRTRQPDRPPRVGQQPQCRFRQDPAGETILHDRHGLDPFRQLQRQRTRPGCLTVVDASHACGERNPCVPPSRHHHIVHPIRCAPAPGASPPLLHQPHRARRPARSPPSPVPMRSP